MRWQRRRKVNKTMRQLSETLAHGSNALSGVGLTFAEKSCAVVDEVGFQKKLERRSARRALNDKLKVREIVPSLDLAKRVVMDSVPLRERRQL